MEDLWANVFASITDDAALINPDLDDRTHVVNTTPALRAEWSVHQNSILQPMGVKETLRVAQKPMPPPMSIPPMSGMAPLALERLEMTSSIRRIMTAVSVAD